MSWSLQIFSPYALWLIIPALAALIILRLYRQRRQELLAGSLLLWKRVAEKQPKTPPRRILFDSSFILQALTLITLILALASPSLALQQSRGRALLLVLDNGPSARARTSDGKPVLAQQQTRAFEILRKLHDDDFVFVAQAAPLSKLLNSEAVTPGAARQLIENIEPAISGPDASKLWLFANDASRNIGKGESIALTIVSTQTSPQPTPNSNAMWLSIAPSDLRPQNVGIIDCGSVPIASDSGSRAQILIRIKNFGASAASGDVALLENNVVRDKRGVSLPADDETSVTFQIGMSNEKPVLIRWQPAEGKEDALPEDDSIVLAPRKVQPPRVRFHAPVAAVEQLYKSALNATILNAGYKGAADLEVYSGSVPEHLKESSGALMLLAPETGYHSCFDVGDKSIRNPKIQRDEPDAITKGVNTFSVSNAQEILPTGDFKSVIKDAGSGRTLVATFIDDSKGKQGYLLAFVPGAGVPANQLLQPDLAALLVRIAMQAAGTQEPFTAERAAEMEMQRGSALPLNWKPDSVTTGAGVLDQATSALAVASRGGNSTTTDFDLSALKPLEQARITDLRPLLIAAALILMFIELQMSATRGGLMGQLHRKTAEQ